MHSFWKDLPPLVGQKAVAGTEVKVAGLVRSARWKKSMVFTNVHDGTTYEPLQAILPTDLADG